jgi:hypothetical protein
VDPAKRLLATLPLGVSRSLGRPASTGCAAVSSSADTSSVRPCLLAPPDELSDHPVRLPERNLPRRQKIREFGSQCEAARRFLYTGAVEGGGAQHLR